MSDEPPPRPTSSHWGLWGAVAALLLAGLLLVWVTDRVLTRRLAEANLAGAEQRLALFSGNLRGELDRQEVVPLLLSRDLVLIGALGSGDYSGTSRHLINFRNDLDAAAMMLLDVEGRVVATTDRARLTAFQGRAPFFSGALNTTGTVFTVLTGELGQSEFYFSRQVRRGQTHLGVIVVEVDLHRFLEGWSRLGRAMALLDAGGQVILATEPSWVGLGAEGLDAMLNASAPAMPWAGLASVGDGEIDGDPVLRQEAPVGFEGWRLVQFNGISAVRDRVNLVLAVELAGLALILALIFFGLSRQAQRRSVVLAHESDRLRRLNQRLQAEISERERAERHLQVAEQTLAQSAKMAALGEMAAAVSHELNQPLAAMKTYLAGAKLLISRARTDEALASIGNIDGLIDRMASITRQMKSHSRKESEDLYPVDVRDCLNAAMGIMAPSLAQSPAQVTCSLPDRPVTVMGDPVRIEQVIVNLIRNALDATSGLAEPRVQITLSLGDSATLTVRDNGNGIANFEALFEPFYTTKPPGQGVGLGLAISSSIVHGMGGRLRARNASDGGAVFRVDLPVISPEIAQGGEDVKQDSDDVTETESAYDQNPDPRRHRR